MLTIKELKDLLNQNELETRALLAQGSVLNTRRLCDLALHRSVLKDSLIQALETELQAAAKVIPMTIRKAA